MGRPRFPRSIMEFQDHFATETACLEYLAASRW
ncbi:MAG TPA: IS1595 family transposase, partial [Thermoleophilaceae bacterium]|nr:IS1595 family transposase [Thermoleophilaceae bacterium]HZI90662.1 IS1595 family transposase [Thermoleophilaceae bacterium]